MHKKIKLGVFISGRGSNFEALAFACKSGELNAEISYLLTDNPSAGGLRIAEEMGITPIILNREELGKNSTLEERRRFEEKIEAAISEFEVDLICLAGFMYFLGAEFVQKFSGRLINIHPSLLPAFPGMHAQQQAFITGTKIVGCTVHLVDSSLDGGKIIAQAALENNCDSLDELEKRILEAEHLTYKFGIMKFLKTGNFNLNLDKTQSPKFEELKQEAWGKGIILA